MTIKTIFIGTPDFALPALKALVRDIDFSVKAVITQPDMPSGRKLVPTPPPVKELALQYKLEVWQPQKIIQVLDNIRALEPDVMVVAAYAQIIPEEILQLPKYGCINIHPSLLPKYRGASPVHAVILNGETETGVTIMLMDKTLDTGPILAQKKIKIDANETTTDLLTKLAELSADMLDTTIKKYIKGQIKAVPQDSSQASYVKMFTKQDGLIDWTKPAAEIERLVRAFTHWPSAWTWVKGKQLKIIEVASEPLDINTYKPGKTFVYNNSLAVQCGTDALLIKRLKLEGKNAISGEAFVHGYKDFLGSILG
jgi:methionyl-tRNA formyltransferase